MSMILDAKEAAILTMLNRWGSQASRLTDKQLRTYLDAVEEMSLEAVEASCREFREGLVERNNEFMPIPVELTINTRRYDRIAADHDARREMGRIVSYPIGAKPPEGFQPLGPTKLEINGRMTDVSHLTFEEKEIAIKTGALPTPEGNAVKLPNMRRI